MSSSLIVEVCEIKEIKVHPNADALEIAIVKGWETVIKKGQYKKGEVVVYIPVDAVLPVELADRLGVRNYLGGKNKDRVRCAKLRGEMSYGLIIDNEGNWTIGTDVAENYCITKYIPPLRTTAGDAAPSDPLFERFTDIENIKNYPDIFVPGELVVVSEKIDGTSGRISIMIEKLSDGTFNVEKKAGSHGVKRKMPEDEEQMKTNTYWFPWTLPEVKTLMEQMTKEIKCELLKSEKSVAIFTLYGEIYGRVRGGHKSMHYGRENSLNFAAFAMNRDGKYFDWEDFKNTCQNYSIPMVPIIDITPFNWDYIKSLSVGDSLLAKINGAVHMREGVVILPVKERRDPIIGRVTAKVLNPEYLLLKEKNYEKGEETDFTDE